MIQGDRTALLQTILPEDPEDGQVVEMPNGQTVGGANVINAYKGGKLCGSISQMTPIFNASGKYEAARFASSTKIRVGDVVRILGVQHNYVSLKFVEYFGWIGHNTDPTPITLMDKSMRVIEAFPLGAYTPGYYLYEKVCLDVLHKGETHAKPTSNTPTAPSRDKTPISGGTTPSGGSSGGAPGTDPTSGSCSSAVRETETVDAATGIAK